MNELLRLLGSIAPALATAVAGPLGGLAVSAIARRLGVEDTVEAVTQAIAADPDAALKLAQIDLDKLKAEYANTENARAMQVAALNQSDVFSKRFVYYFAAFWSLAACLYIGFITFTEIPEKNLRFVDTILGVCIGGIITTILNYFYGSSQQSAKKTELMSK
jgi:CDP-diglyceride synthetase